jgi:uncharacterized protein (DUF2236 family)
MPSVNDARRADALLGFYGPDSMMWRINREAVLLGAGPAALLLQVAHPSVARGVADHSDFERDPFGRLRRTLITTMDLVFGDGARAEAAVRRLNSVHAGVRGAGYRALDPELLLWVQVALIRTSVDAYTRWVGPLTEQEKEQFWQEARQVGVRIGIPLKASPADWTALTDYWQRMISEDGPIHATDTARRLAPTILRPPLPLPSGLVDLLALPGLALLPPRLRSEFGISWSTGKAALANALGKSVRAWTSMVPVSLRSMPQARSAFARAGHGAAQVAAERSERG